MLPTCWKWDNALSDDLIELFLKDVSNSQLQKGTLLHDGVTGKLDEVVRKNDVVIYPAYHFLAGTLLNYAMIANHAARWNRDLKGVDCVQYAQYGVDEFYDWHVDTKMLTSDPFHRKLTVVCLLNDPSEFEGGLLELDLVQEQPILGKGSVIVFPSHVRHRVTPVSKGIRKTATSWIMGPTTW